MTQLLYTPLPYDPEQVGVSILHFGPGAFHRAHQAVYTHDLIAKTKKDYGICAVSLHSSSVRDALSRQDYVYTLAVLDREVSFRAIGSIREILVAPENPRAVIERLADPTIETVTLTITEKGYTLAGDGQLNVEHPDIVHDLHTPDSPRSAVGYLVAGLVARRRALGLGLTLISCDNLPGNGRKLAGAVVEFAARSNPGLAQWIGSNCHFPCTVVDSITPASDDALKHRVQAATGVEDAWPIQREAFSQWVIEDTPGAALPPWQKVGAIVSQNVEGFERAKLRILNGLHSSMTFLGLLLGLKTVEEAARHPALRSYLETMCRDEILPTLQPVEKLDLSSYARSILGRFENPAITHQLAQIAWDSSQKLPIRILTTLQSNLSTGRPSPRLTLAAAAWMAMVRLYAAVGTPLTDPLAERLLSMGRSGAGASAFLTLREVFADELTANPQFRNAIHGDFETLIQGPAGVMKALERL